MPESLPRLSERLQASLAVLPDKPGCYLMRDRRGKIIYIGKAASLRKRVQSYFRESTWRRADLKLKGLLHSVEDLDIVVLRTEAEALLTESQLIKEYKPRYNVDFRDDKRFLMIRVHLDDPWPMFKAVRIRRDDGAIYLGPYISSAATRAAMDFVERRFGLRKCAPRVPGPLDHKHCINDIVRFCSAPCVGRIDRADYLARVSEACAFLRGERPGLLDSLRVAMKECSAAGRYEDAASLRDTWFMLKELLHQRARARLPVTSRAGDAREGLHELQSVLQLPAIPVLIECYDVSNISGTLAVASMVCLVAGRPAPSRYRHFNIRTVAHSDDPAMMAEVIHRRFLRLQTESRKLPDLVIVDGGITQLRAAVNALARLAMGKPPRVIALAKRNEEIFLEQNTVPIRLPNSSKALRVLQSARDEAHRFALDHHRRLRARRIRESIVDEVPGIGEIRKAELLRRFGSVHRLRRATPQQIAEVPGIGWMTALSLYNSLHPGSASPEKSN